MQLNECKNFHKWEKHYVRFGCPSLHELGLFCFILLFGLAIFTTSAQKLWSFRCGFCYCYRFLNSLWENYVQQILNSKQSIEHKCIFKIEYCWHVWRSFKFFYLKNHNCTITLIQLNESFDPFRIRLLISCFDRLKPN